MLVSLLVLSNVYGRTVIEPAQRDQRRKLLKRQTPGVWVEYFPKLAATLHHHHSRPFAGAFDLDQVADGQEGSNDPKIGINHAS